MGREGLRNMACRNGVRLGITSPRFAPRCCALIDAHDHRFHFFTGSPVRYQKVNHALGLDEQVTAKEEDAEDDGEGEDAHDGDLNRAHDEHTALIVLGRRRKSIISHHRREVTAKHLFGPVRKQAAVRLVKRRAVHLRACARNNCAQTSFLKK